MVSNENTRVVESRCVDAKRLPTPTAEETRWRDFWYDLRGQIEPSWLAEEGDANSSPRLISNSDSAFVWHSIYGVLVKKFELDAHYSSDDLVQAGLWYELLPRLCLNPHAWVEAAGVVGLFNARLESEEIKGAKILSSASGRQLVVRLAKCLTLYQRCGGTGISDPRVCGLWLLFQSLKSDYPQGWKRLRLRFKKSLIVEVEQKKINSPTPADTRAFRRLWSALADKLEL